MVVYSRVRVLLYCLFCMSDVCSVIEEKKDSKRCVYMKEINMLFLELEKRYASLQVMISLVMSFVCFLSVVYQYEIGTVCS